MYQRQKERNLNYRTPLQEWIDVLHIFENDIDEADKGDDALYLIKQYARFYEYRGDYYNSLTEVARLITGTLCSGPAFFNRKSKIYVV